MNVTAFFTALAPRTAGVAIAVTALAPVSVAAGAGAVATAATMSGCDAQVDASYRGESLARLQGTIVNKRTSTPDNISAALLWTPRDPSVSSKLEIIEQVPVRGEFPASFVLDVKVPPPDGAWLLLTDGPKETRYATANIGIIEVAPVKGPNGEGHVVLATDLAHALVAFETDVKAGSLLEKRYGLRKKGFHLMAQVMLEPPTPEARAACVTDVTARGLSNVPNPPKGSEAESFCDSEFLVWTWKEVPFDTRLSIRLEDPSAPSSDDDGGAVPTPNPPKDDDGGDAAPASPAPTKT